MSLPSPPSRVTGTSRKVAARRSLPPEPTTATRVTLPVQVAVMRPVETQPGPTRTRVEGSMTEYSPPGPRATCTRFDSLAPT
jgi:hypothetical protein